MKPIFYLFIILPIFMFSQTEVKSFNEVNIAYAIPNQLGNSFLKEGYKNNFGFLLETEIITYRRFGLVTGLLINKFKAIDKSISGNISTASRKESQIKLVYHYNLVDKISLNPYIGFGLNQLKETGKTNGKSYIIGTNFNYNFFTDISLLIGIQYSHYKYDVLTNALEKDFFDTSNNIQFNLGFNFRFSKLD